MIDRAVAASAALEIQLWIDPDFDIVTSVHRSSENSVETVRRQAVAYRGRRCTDGAVEYKGSGVLLDSRSMKTRSIAAVLPIILSVAACTTDVDLGQGVRQRGDHLLFYDGPELRASLGTHQTSRSIGDEWLVLAAQLRPGLKAGMLTVGRGSVSVRTPDGRRLPLISQDEYRKIYGKVRVRVERAVASLPVVGVYEQGQIPCARWFLVGPFEGFAYDEISVNTFQVCSGPLVFHVPGGVQPGRWRLVIELEESTADLPFEIEVPD